MSVTKRILINSTRSDELRVGIMDISSKTLLDLLSERKNHINKVGNIYWGKITAVEPSLDACFVDFGVERHGFLPFKAIQPEYFSGTDTHTSDKPFTGKNKSNLKVGQKVMIQVDKEERGNKGAALTTYISLAGSYLVLMPNNPRAGGVSRRVEGGDRDELREVLSNLPIPDEMGLIIRTAGVGKAIEELQWDMNTLLRQWDAIQKVNPENVPFLVYQESDVLIRAIRDYLREDVSEILVDDPALFERLKEHLEQIRPDFVRCLKLYNGNVPLFSVYQIEHQIEAAHDREVRLPSGGVIVIDHTEALVAVDVNSAQATKGKDIEQTAFEINKEAARMIACQLRLRDIGGLIVIDFIDMSSVAHRKEVENELRNALKLDKARTQVGTISRHFGLVVVSRQRLRQSLGESTRLACPRCDGWGSIRDIESLSLSILRIIEEYSVRPNTTQIQVQVPVDVATFIINEKREMIHGIEIDRQVKILIIPNPKLESPHYHIKRFVGRDGAAPSKVPSYSLIDTEEIADLVYKKQSQHSQEQEAAPMVKDVTMDPFPVKSSQVKGIAMSFLKKFVTHLFGSDSEEKNKTQKVEQTSSISTGQTLRGYTQKSPLSPSQHPSSDRPVSGNVAAQQRNKNRPTSPIAARRSPKSISKTPFVSVSTPEMVKARPKLSIEPIIVNPENLKSIPVIKPASLSPSSPPDYPQAPLTDVELEKHYPESRGSKEKRPVRPAKRATADNQLSKTPDKTVQPINRTIQPITSMLSHNVAEPGVQVPPKELLKEKTTEIVKTPIASKVIDTTVVTTKLEAPVIVENKATEDKVVVADKLWVPRKIAPAPAVKQEQAISVTPTTPIVPTISVDPTVDTSISKELRVLPQADAEKPKKTAILATDEHGLNTDEK